MIEAARDLHDDELEAAVDAALALREQPEYVRGCSVTAAHCATMVHAYVDEFFGGYTNQRHAAGLRELADSMIRLGVR